ncbi:MAG: ComF family protein [Opitutaceae bacterium]|nr:ComF family protein [Opitutaceae bacterium]
MHAAIRQWAQGAVDAVFPPVCVHCQTLVEGSPLRHLCAVCAAKVAMVQPPCCSTCGHPFYGIVEGERMCPHCEGLAPAFREGRTCVLLKGPARALVHALKYHHGLYVLTDMGRIFACSPGLADWVAGANLVPVPLHRRKERERGFNQSRLIAETLSRVFGGLEIADVLVREVDTVSQTHHDKKTRQANLKNAFSLAKGTSINPARHYILIDDVFTTGSTLNSCALALRRAGCLNLDVITFGHG